MAATAPTATPAPAPAAPQPTPFQEAAALVIFGGVMLLTLALTLYPVSLPLPAALVRRFRLRSSRLSISYAAAPVAGTLLMLSTGVLDGDSLRTGVVGDERMKPYGIVILFMALVFMASSLDMTGCFQFVALQLTRASRGNGLALFLLYYALSSSITVVTSNDVSIMTLTPIILYCALATGADPVPFLTAMFTAANIWSMLLFVGNPTNIIVATAYGMSFLDFTKWMALPTIGAGVGALAAVLGVHWRSIPKRLQLPDLHPSAMLVDPPGAIFGTANILACLALLAAAPALKWELWLITLCCAALHALYNCAAYVALKGRWCRSQQHSRPGLPQAVAQQQAGLQQRQPAAGAAALDLLEGGQLELVGLQQQQQQVDDGGHSQSCRQQPVLITTPQQGGPADAAVNSSAAGLHHRQPAAAVAAEQLSAPDDPDLLRARSRSCSRQQLLTAQQHAACSDAAAAAAVGRSSGVSPVAAAAGFDSKTELPDADLPSSGAATAAEDAAAAAAAGGGSSHGLQPPPMPTFWRAVTVLPWEIVPFVLGMFCVVEGLNASGWVDRLAACLAGGLAGSVWGALFAVGGLSVLLANIINNQPMTILMTRVCMSPAFLAPLAAASAGKHSAAVPLASAFAVVVASNTAAMCSVIGALAGIMFVSILQQRGFNRLGNLAFSKLTLPAGVASTVLALCVLGAEFTSWSSV